MLLLASYIVNALSKENAVLLILCRNSDINGISNSLREFEETFNKTYGYPYVFLNDEDFTDDFKSAISKVISSPASFGKLTSEQWGPPAWIDLEKAQKSMDALNSMGIIYGGSLSYRNMCRFFSGFFYKHDLVKEYEYFWRIEPDVNFYCTMNYDPFEYMKKNKKLYGFTITIREFMETIPTLWQTTLEFLEMNRNILNNNEILNFISNEDKSYNGCHFWSNFEIASFEFFRSEIYEKYFAFLDKAGGFYYERWGDAPIHSIAASLFLSRDQIHFFDDIGYRHNIYQHCPTAPSRQVECKCDPNDNVDNLGVSCLHEYLKMSL
ncbi:hypothetical protein COBT_000066 [Conglomerata obtusa]